MVPEYPKDNDKVQYLAWLHRSLEPFYFTGLPIEEPEEPLLITPLQAHRHLGKGGVHYVVQYKEDKSLPGISLQGGGRKLP